jgi:hypothetical protein
MAYANELLVAERAPKYARRERAEAMLSGWKMIFALAVLAAMLATYVV